MQIRTKGTNDRLATLRGTLEPGNSVTFSYNDKAGHVTVSAVIDSNAHDVIRGTCIYDHLEECPKVADILGTSSLQKNMLNDHVNDLVPVSVPISVSVSGKRMFSENDGMTLSYGSLKQRNWTKKTSSSNYSRIRTSWAQSTVTISKHGSGYKIVSSNELLPILFTSPSQENLMSLVDDYE